MKSGAKNYYNYSAEEQIEKAIDSELNQVFKYFLEELKKYIQHDLRLDKKKERDECFWKIIGNPLYRILEKRIAEDYRTNEDKNRLFEKIFY